MFKVVLIVLILYGCELSYQASPLLGQGSLYWHLVQVCISVFLVLWRGGDGFPVVRSHRQCCGQSLWLCYPYLFVLVPWVLASVTGFLVKLSWSCSGPQWTWVISNLWIMNPTNLARTKCSLWQFSERPLYSPSGVRTPLPHKASS